MPDRVFGQASPDMGARGVRKTRWKKKKKRQPSGAHAIHETVIEDGRYTVGKVRTKTGRTEKDYEGTRKSRMGRLWKKIRKNVKGGSRERGRMRRWKIALVKRF